MNDLLATRTGRNLIALAIVAVIAAVVLLRAVILSRKPGGRGPKRQPPNPTQSPIAESDAEGVVNRAGEAALAVARERAPHAWMTALGAVHIYPSALGIWIMTRTDAERDALAADLDLQERMREAVRASGFPVAGLPRTFSFESQETCDRDYGGNWFHVIK